MSPFQESNDNSTTSMSMQVHHHVLNKVLDINEDEIASFQNRWNTEVMTTSLTYVSTFIMNWIISMTTEWMN